MIDLWRKYKIFIKKQDRSKWSKLFRKIENFRRSFKCKQSQIEEETMQNKIKMVLIKQLLAQLKRDVKIRQSRAFLRKKQKKLYKNFRKSLSSIFAKRKKALEKLKKKKKIKNKISGRKSSRRRSSDWSSKTPTTALTTYKVSKARRRSNVKAGKLKKAGKISKVKTSKLDPAFMQSYNLMMKEFTSRPDPELTKQRLREKVEKDKELLKAINAKIVCAINDINEMDQVIKHIKNGTYDHFKMKPFMDTLHWMKPPKDKKATIVMDRVTRAHRKKFVREDIFDLKRQFILDNIPECKLQMFDYLKRK